MASVAKVIFVVIVRVLVDGEHQLLGDETDSSVEVPVSLLQGHVGIAAYELIQEQQNPEVVPTASGDYVPLTYLKYPAQSCLSGNPIDTDATAETMLTVQECGHKCSLNSECGCFIYQSLNSDTGAFYGKCWIESECNAFACKVIPEVDTYVGPDIPVIEVQPAGAEDQSGIVVGNPVAPVTAAPTVPTAGVVTEAVYPTAAPAAATTIAGAPAVTTAAPSVGTTVAVATDATTMVPAVATTAAVATIDTTIAPAVATTGAVATTATTGAPDVATTVAATVVSTAAPQDALRRQSLNAVHEEAASRADKVHDEDHSEPGHALYKPLPLPLGNFVDNFSAFFP